MARPVPGHAAFAEPVTSSDGAYRLPTNQRVVHHLRLGMYAHRAVTWHAPVLLKGLSPVSFWIDAQSKTLPFCFLRPQRQGDEDGAPIHRQPARFDRAPGLILL